MSFLPSQSHSSEIIIPDTYDDKVLEIIINVWFEKKFKGKYSNNVLRV